MIWVVFFHRSVNKRGWLFAYDEVIVEQQALSELDIAPCDSHRGVLSRSLSTRLISAGAGSRDLEIAPTRRRGLIAPYTCLNHGLHGIRGLGGMVGGGNVPRAREPRPYGVTVQPLDPFARMKLGFALPNPTYWRAGRPRPYGKTG